MTPRYFGPSRSNSHCQRMCCCTSLVTASAGTIPALGPQTQCHKLKSVQTFLSGLCRLFEIMRCGSKHIFLINSKIKLNELTSILTKTSFLLHSHMATRGLGWTSTESTWPQTHTKMKWWVGFLFSVTLPASMNYLLFFFEPKTHKKTNKPALHKLVLKIQHKPGKHAVNKLNFRFSFKFLNLLTTLHNLN